MCWASKADNHVRRVIVSWAEEQKDREREICLLGADRWEWTWLRAWNKRWNDKVKWIMWYWSISRKTIFSDKIAVLLWWVGKSDNCVSSSGVCLWSALLFYAMYGVCSLVKIRSHRVTYNVFLFLLWTDRWQNRRQLVDVSGFPQLEIPKPIDA